MFICTAMHKQDTLGFEIYKTDQLMIKISL